MINKTVWIHKIGDLSVDSFHLYLLLGITFAIALLSVAVFILSYTGKNYGCPEDSQFNRKE